MHLYIYSPLIYASTHTHTHTYTYIDHNMHMYKDDFMDPYFNTYIQHANHQQIHFHAFHDMSANFVSCTHVPDMQVDFTINACMHTHGVCVTIGDDAFNTSWHVLVSLYIYTYIHIHIATYAFYTSWHVLVSLCSASCTLC
jgi:hypothetical protein